MIASLEARLEASPEDVEGWRMLGWSRFRTGDVEGARQAYQKAVDLAPDDAQTLSALGEAQARVAGGFVNDAAVANLQKAVSLDPGDPRARFLLGLRKEQDGDAKGALDDWIALIETAEPGAEWQDEVRTRILELSQQSGIDVTGRIPDAVLQAVGGPSPQAIVEAEEMSAQERADMIEGMVTRLDQKLRADPENLEGWMRLIRARRVLNQEDLAADALKRARSVFAADAVALMQLDDAATGAMDTPAD
jgi:cytochrome c-type biogenesis protein CcmH